MKYTDLTRQQISSLPVYQPGKPIELVAREKGIPLETILKLASNENPLGSPPGAVAAVRKAASNMALYPDNSGYELVMALSRKHGWAPQQITLGAGSNEIFYRLCDLFAGPGTEVLVGEYAFISYRISAMLAGATVVSVPMPALQHDLQAMLDAVTPQTRLVFIPNPNNPTGTGIAIADVEAFARALPESVVFCYDEAYAEYESEQLDVQGLIQDGVKIIGTRTFSKIYGLAGERVGWATGAPHLIDVLNRIRGPFNVNSSGQAAATAALDDQEFVTRSRDHNAQELARFTAAIEALGNHGLRPIPSKANFLLVLFEGAVTAERALSAISGAGYAVRHLPGQGLPNALRITIGHRSDMDQIASTLRTLCGESK